MAFDKVNEYFKQYGMDGRIRVFDVSSATVELAAAALGCEGKRIAKSLSFDGGADGAMLIVAAGDAKVDNQAFKARFGMKAKMLPPDETERLIGHAVGGVCPFALNDGVKVFFDRSLRRFETVFPACGSDNSAIELSIAEMEKYARPVEWVDVCKGWREEK